MEKPLVSVIIPARNEEESIGNAIKSILIQKYPRKEIIVMDNASTDRTAEIARSFGIKVVVNKKNIGYVKSVNKGIKLAKGRYMILLHTDHFTHDKEWINKMIEPLSDKKIGAVISQRLNKHRAKMNFAERLFDSLAEMEWNNTGKLKEVSTLREKCDAYRKSVIKELGYFDENSYPHGGDDIDMSVRMRNAGYKISLSHNAFVEHTFSSSQNSMLTVFKKCIQMGKAGTTIYKRYKIDALRRRMLLLSFFSLMLIPTLSSLLGLVSYSLLFLLGIFSTIKILNLRIPISFISFIIFIPIYFYTGKFSIPTSVILTHSIILLYYGLHSTKSSLRSGDKAIYLPFIFIFSIICRFLFAIGYLKEYIATAISKKSYN